MSSFHGAAAAGTGLRAGRRPAPAAHVADRRGLTAAGAVTLVLGLALAGASVDVLTGPGLRTVFAGCFVIGCVAAAALVHREDLLAAVVMPPLLYAVVALLAAAVQSTGYAGSWLSRQLLEMTTSMVTGAPVLFLATAAAALLALLRFASHRAGVRR